jgi:uncharacterized membrane protein
MSLDRNPLDRYLATFRDGLRGAPAAEREEYIGEIESHIAEAMAAGERADDVLARLGPADRLARGYRVELALSSGDANAVWRVVAVLGLLVTASIPSMIIIPLMLGLGVGGVAGGIATIVFASVPALDANFYNIQDEGLNRTMGGLTGAGLVVMGLLCFWVLYLYVLLIVRAMRGALRIGS